MFAINLGGEGEIPGVINQQGPWALSPRWFSSQQGLTFPQLLNAGDAYLICPNISLPFPDETFDVVFTNSVPLDRITSLGPGVQSSEIQRILKSGGRWNKDGKLEWTKP